jgi:hypothetical protein
MSIMGFKNFDRNLSSLRKFEGDMFESMGELSIDAG